MRGTRRFSTVLVAAIVAGAGAQVRPNTAPYRTSAAQTAQYVKLKKASAIGVVNLSTGDYTKFDNNNTSRVLVPVFNSIDSSIANAPGGLNYSWSAGGGTFACEFNDPNVIIGDLYIHPMSQDGCADTPAFQSTWSNNLDILQDNYFVDPTNWGLAGDPNETDTIEQIDLIVGYTDAAGRATAGLVVGFYEWLDRNGDGFFYRVSSGPWLYILPLVQGAGQYQFLLNTAGLGLTPYGWDMMLVDIVDSTYDPNTGLPTGAPMCGVYLPIAGGLREKGNVNFGHLIGDPNGPGCQNHDLTMSVGAVTFPDIGSDIWVLQNGFADPNGAAIDPNSNGVPGLQYEEIWHFGTGVWLTWVLGDSLNWTRLPNSGIYRLHVAAADVPCGAPGELCPDSGAVRIAQVDFRDAPDSTVGVLRIDVLRANLATGLFEGYINVADPLGRWVVRNLPVRDALVTGYTRILVYFDLTFAAGVPITNGQDIAAGQFRIFYTPQPLVDFHEPGVVTYVIGSFLERFGGMLAPRLPAVIRGYRATPPAVEITSPPEDPNGLDYHVRQPGHPDQEAAHNQCFPMAVANSMQWLEDTTDIVIPQEHAPGLRKDVDPNDPNSLVGEIERHMDRPVVDRFNGAGVYGGDGLRGKLDYIDATGLAHKMVTKHQGLLVGDPNDPNSDTVTGAEDVQRGSARSHGRGGLPTFDWILGELEDAEDVEMLVQYVNPNWDPNDPNSPRFIGGHAVELVGGGYTNGRPYLEHLSDLRQADPNHPNWDDPNDPNSGTGEVWHDDIETDPNQIPPAGNIPGLPYLRQSQAVVVGVISESRRCEGDLDGDGDVDLTDLAVLLANFENGSTPEDGDIDGDGDVDLTDLAVLLARFELPCP